MPTDAPTTVPADVPLTSLRSGGIRTIEEWTTTFHLALVVLDPYTHESAWLLETAGRILREYHESDCRTAFLVTADATDARRFLGPWADEMLAFTDPDRVAVKAMGLATLPAFVHVDQRHQVAARAEGWDPAAWRGAIEELSGALGWSRPVIPDVGDPAPFPGSPAGG